LALARVAVTTPQTFNLCWIKAEFLEEKMMQYLSSDNSLNQEVGKIKSLDSLKIAHPFYLQALEGSLACLRSHTPTLMFGAAGVGLSTLAEHLGKLFPESIVIKAPFSLPSQQNWRNLHLKTLQALNNLDVPINLSNEIDHLGDCAVADIQIEGYGRQINKNCTLLELSERLIKKLSHFGKNSQ
jgi:hypothetical protein